METSAYDSIAPMYDALWADWYWPAARPALEHLLFSRVPPRSRVLDVCCGSGHITAKLAAYYRMTGVDNSIELIRLARNAVPSAEFQIADVRELSFENCFDGAVSTFDSLNHMLSLQDLEQVFSGVWQALKPGGIFVFDMNLEEAYSADLRTWSVNLEGDTVGLVRGTFDFETKLAETRLIWFTKQSAECWRRQESVVKERCYAQSEILLGLKRSGFERFDAVPAASAGVTAELGFGRVYFSAERPL